ncbi:MAG TPA: hypothetical protein VHM19_13720 [Polyangiales bacterium]|jgi:hypothetical protein|nr:hypothetical protein [Polyangiales bacterium]
MTRRTLLIVFSGLVVALAMALVRPSHHDDVRRAVVGSADPAPAHPAAAAEPPSSGSASADVRPEPAVPALADAHELDAFLAQLQSKMRAQNAVSADQQHLGVLAIRSMSAKLGRDVALARTRNFLLDMAHLQKQLELAPVQAELRALAQQIGQQSDGVQRGVMIAKYRAKAASLPPLFRIAALDRLQEVTDATASAAPVAR